MSAAVDAGPALRVSSAGGQAADAVASAARAAADSLRVVETGPTGVERFSPLVLATADGETAFHPNCTEDAVEELVATLEDGDLPRDGADAIVDHDADAGRLPMPDRGPLSVGRRRALGRSGWLHPTDPDDYREVAGAVSERVADGVAAALRTVGDVGLRGRGRGDGVTDEPVAGAWTTAREAEGDPVVVVNANEADDSAWMDDTLLLGDPLAVVDAALAVAWIVDAKDVVVYVNEDADLARRRVQAAATTLPDALGDDRDVQVAVGPDEYKAGEMTMAIESLEGADRIEARRRPPGPERYGLYGRPTVVHTPRTLAQVRELLADTGAFDPDDGDPGTRIVTVTGDVADPATVELRTGATLADALDAVQVEGRRKAYCVGGQFGGVTRDLDLPASAGALRGSDLGTNGVVEVCNEDTCMLALAGSRAHFASAENCGRCYPGREGTKQLTGLLRDIYDGEYKDDMLRELVNVVRTSALCEFGRDATRPVETAMDRFEAEFVAHSQGRCPAGTCDVAGQAAETEHAGATDR